MSKTNTSGIGDKLNMSLTSTFCEKVETEIKKIIYYNYMDCIVIVDILEMLEGMI